MTIRILLISDIHGNYPALQAIDRQLDASSFDYIVNSGDSLVYAPFPNETISWLQRASGHLHSRQHRSKKYIKFLSGKKVKKPGNPEKRIMYTATAEALNDASRRYLCSLTTTAKLKLRPSRKSSSDTQRSNWASFMAVQPIMTNFSLSIRRTAGFMNWPAHDQLPDCDNRPLTLAIP